MKLLINPSTRTVKEVTPLKTLPNGGMLFGLEYVSNNAHSWCYLTIGNNSVVATQLDTHIGRSITNSWSRRFFEALADLAPIKAGSNWRWFEHYHRNPSAKGQYRFSSSIDEVFLIEGRDNHAGEIKWEPRAYDEFRGHDKSVPVSNCFREITGEDLPGFASTGYGRKINERVRETPFIHDPPIMITMGQCAICGQGAVIDPEADPYPATSVDHNNKPCPGFNAGKLLNDILNGTGGGVENEAPSGSIGGSPIRESESQK
jgi:hypothetical protein